MQQWAAFLQLRVCVEGQDWWQDVYQLQHTVLAPTHAHVHVSAADMLKEDKTGGKKFMDFGGEIIPFAAANNIKVGQQGTTARPWHVCLRMLS
jgi:hypothetical protein